jgi:hypothetical protein
MTTQTPDIEMIAVGSGALHSLRRSLSRDLGEQAAIPLQEAGFGVAAGLRRCRRSGQIGRHRLGRGSVSVL